MSLSPPRAESTLVRRMRACHLFTEWSVDELLNLEPHARLVHAERGDYLWHMGDEPVYVHYIISGLVEIRRPTPGCEMTLMAFFGPTECPGTPVVLESRRYGADALVTSNQATLLAINAVMMRELMRRDARAATAMNRVLLSQVRLLHGKIDVMAAGTVARRLALFFLNLASRFGDEAENGDLIIPMVLSRQQIATYIDARVETVIRTLSCWRKSGVMTTRRNHIEIHDIGALRRAIQGDSPIEPRPLLQRPAASA